MAEWISGEGHTRKDLIDLLQDAIKALENERNVVYSASFSKCLSVTGHTGFDIAIEIYEPELDDRRIANVQEA